MGERHLSGGARRLARLDANARCDASVLGDIAGFFIHARRTAAGSVVTDEADALIVFTTDDAAGFVIIKIDHSSMIHADKLDNHRLWYGVSSILVPVRDLPQKERELC